MKNKPDTGEKAIHRFLNGVYTRQEAKEALELLRDTQNDLLIDACMSGLWQEIQHTSGADGPEYNRDLKNAGRLLNEIGKNTVTRRLVRKALTLAASVAILISIGGSFFYFLDRGSHKKEDILCSQVSTTYGQTRDIILPDGTKVTLNACSHISYPERFTGNERHVKLKGEAYFQVAKNEKRTFVVNTGGFEVQVLGTVFSIKAYEEDEVQSVDVESGKVRVDMPEGMSCLYANEQIEINAGSGSYAKQPSGYKDIAVWRKGYLRFSKTPVEDVARELERVYDYKIVFNAEQEFENFISGEHDNQNMEEVLESIRLTTGIKWINNKEDRTVVMSK